MAAPLSRVAAEHSTSTRGSRVELSNFIGSFYQSQAVTADDERTINFYPERIESPGAPVRLALYPTPGVTKLSEAANGAGRAHYFIDNREFSVIGTTLYEIDINGTMTSRGTVALNGNPATISSNGDGGGQLFITSGGNGYIFTLSTNTLTQVAALNGIATMGDHLDGYFLALDSAVSKLYISALLDGLTWSTGTDFAQRSIAPDPWIAMKVVSRNIWLFGEQTSEVWYNSGAASFPFTAHPSGFVPYGCAAAFSPQVLGREIIWLSTSRLGAVQVSRAAGFTPETISSYPVQARIGTYATRSDAVGDVYQEDGHSFYILSFPTQGVTWCWDSETQQWHERGTWVVADNAYTALRPRYHAYAFNEHRMLDSDTGALYRMASSISTDIDGNGIRRLRRAPALVSEHRRIFYSSFELDLEPGLGLTTGQGSDPQAMMRMSNDGGKTWGAERWRSAGKLGEFGRRVRWNRCGSGRRRVFEVVMSDPIPWRLTGAWLTLGQPLPQGR